MFSDSFGIGGVHIVTFTIPVSVCNVKAAVIVRVVTVHGVQLCTSTEYLRLISELSEGNAGFDGWELAGRALEGSVFGFFPVVFPPAMENELGSLFFVV